MTSSQVSLPIQKYLYEKSHIYQACNYKRSGYTEADILAITSSMRVTEIEIKVSRGDFKSEFINKDYKHNQLKSKKNDFSKIPNRYYFAVPENLVSLEEIPDYAGLIYVSESQEVTIIKQAPLLHKEKAEEKLILGMLENLTAKTVFGCQYMTYKAKNLR